MILRPSDPVTKPSHPERPSQDGMWQSASDGKDEQRRGLRAAVDFPGVGVDELRWFKPFNHKMPIGSMYGMLIYIWVIYRANVCKYSLHVAYRIWEDHHT